MCIEETVPGKRRQAHGIALGQFNNCQNERRANNCGILDFGTVEHTELKCRFSAARICTCVGNCTEMNYIPINTSNIK